MNSEFIASLNFILQPSKWPLRPFLPLKRLVDGKLQCAVLMEGVPDRTIQEADRNRVGCWLVEDAIVWALSSEEVTKKGRLVHPEDVVNEGWRID